MVKIVMVKIIDNLIDVTYRVLSPKYHLDSLPFFKEREFSLGFSPFELKTK